MGWFPRYDGGHENPDLSRLPCEERPRSRHPIDTAQKSPEDRLHLRMFPGLPEADISVTVG